MYVSGGETPADTTPEPSMSSTALALRAFAAPNHFGPAFNRVVVEYGHAHSRAKFSSTCKLTGDVINVGEFIRMVSVMDRDGAVSDFCMSNRMFGIVFGTISWIEPGADESTSVMADRASRCVEGWTQAFSDAPTGTVIHVWQRGDNRDSRKAYRKVSAQGWKSSSSYSEQSTKKITSALKRSTRAVIYRVIPPATF